MVTADPPTPRALRVLAVLTSPAHRALARALCGRVVPGAHCQDASTVTDAVLALLTGPVDLVLVDVDWAGDLLPGLAQHVRRSAPKAGLLGFGTLSGTHPAMHAAWWPGGMHGWNQLPQVLEDWLQGWCEAQASMPRVASGTKTFGHSG